MNQRFFSNRSAANLAAVHPHLIAVASMALVDCPFDFAITEGRRSKARQAELFASNKSKTMNSRHITGHAIDIALLVNGTVSWDFAHYEEAAETFNAIANQLGIPLEWGGNWRKFRDGPHYQLPWVEYPA